MKKTLTINSPRGAAALEHPTSRHILLELVARECTLKELSESLKLSLSLLTYHVDRCCRLELVQITRQDSRAGRPVKRYRAVAKEFFVPSGLVSKSPAHALAEELRTALEHESISRSSSGTVYFVDQKCQPRIRRVDAAPTGGRFEAWTVLEIGVQAAEQLGNELRALISKYAARGEKNKRPFLVHCALTPRKRN